MTLNPLLCVDPSTFRELKRDDDGTVGLVRDFFFVSPQDPQYSAAAELLTTFSDFCNANLRREDSAAALFTILTELHSQNISRTATSYDELRRFAKQRIVTFSMECPPFYASFFDAEDLPLISQFLDTFYLRDYKLWRYLFCPTPLLYVSVRPALHICTVQSPEQLGRALEEAPAEQRPPSATGKKTTAKPSKKPAEEPEQPAPPRSQPLPFTCAPLPLSQAELYVPPEPKSAEELASEAVRGAIQDAMEPQGQEEGLEEPPAEPHQPLDVEKLGEAIEIATRAELEKIKTQILAEIEAARAQEGAKKK